MALPSRRRQRHHVQRRYRHGGRELSLLLQRKLGLYCSGRQREMAHDIHGAMRHAQRSDDRQGRAPHVCDDALAVAPSETLLLCS